MDFFFEVSHGCKYGFPPGLLPFERVEILGVRGLLSVQTTLLASFHRGHENFPNTFPYVCSTHMESSQPIRSFLGADSFNPDVGTLTLAGFVKGVTQCSTFPFSISYIDGRYLPKQKSTVQSISSQSILLFTLVWGIKTFGVFTDLLIRMTN